MVPYTQDGTFHGRYVRLQLSRAIHKMVPFTHYAQDDTFHGLHAIRRGIMFFWGGDMSSEHEHARDYVKKIIVPPRNDWILDVNKKGYVLQERGCGKKYISTFQSLQALQWERD